MTFFAFVVIIVIFVEISWQYFKRMVPDEYYLLQVTGKPSCGWVADDAVDVKSLSSNS